MKAALRVRARLCDGACRRELNMGVGDWGRFKIEYGANELGLRLQASGREKQVEKGEKVQDPQQRARGQYTHEEEIIRAGRSCLPRF